MTSELFYLINVLPAPIWATWMLAPRSGAARYFAGALWPFALIALAYALLLTVAMFFVDGAPEARMDSLAGVMAIFDSEWSTLAGWCHYICFDVFVARWMVNDAPNAGYRLFPVLVLTLFFGPTAGQSHLTLWHDRKLAACDCPLSAASFQRSAKQSGQ